jgi:adenylate kinase family enzyme
VEKDSGKPPPLEDLPLREIIPVVNPKGKLDEIKGYILVGYPHNEDQLAALKAFNIPIDKYILLSDNSEENPYKTLAKRLSDTELEQLQSFTTAIAPVKEALGEEVFREITNLEQTP